MDFLTFMSELGNATMRFLEGFLDTQYLGATLICFAVAYVFNPKGWPKFIEQIVVSIVFGAIGIVALLLLFRLPFAVAAIVAMVEIFAGLIWVRSHPKKMIYRVLITIVAIGWFFFTIFTITNYSNLDPLSDSIPTIWTVVTNFSGFVYNVFGEWLKSW